VIDEVEVELCVCEECARILSAHDEESKRKNGDEQIQGDFLWTGEESADMSTAVRCPDCGTQLVNFMNSLEVGCPKCYSFFHPLIEKLGGVNSAKYHYEGRKPHRGVELESMSSVTGDAETLSDPVSKQQEKIIDLKAKLDVAIMLENYEEADKINKALIKLEAKETVKKETVKKETVKKKTVKKETVKKKTVKKETDKRKQTKQNPTPRRKQASPPVKEGRND